MVHTAMLSGRWIRPRDKRTDRPGGFDTKEMAMATEHAAHHPHTIEFLIDGDPYTTEERELTVGEILRLAGKDPASYYLVEIKGQRERDPHKDPAEEIKLHPNSKFVTVSSGDTPVS